MNLGYVQINEDYIYATDSGMEVLNQIILDLV